MYEPISNSLAPFPLKDFYCELDEWIATFGAEATLMNMHDGVMAVLRYRVGGIPHVAIMTQYIENKKGTEIHFFSLSGEEKINNFAAAITRKVV